jgi:hypothetical protein
MKRRLEVVKDDRVITRTVLSSYDVLRCSDDYS